MGDRRAKTMTLELMEDEMIDTRETYALALGIAEVPAKNAIGWDIPKKRRPQPRFKKGDRVLHPIYEGQDVILTVHRCFWNRELRGWQVVISSHSIAVHESNFILPSERDRWEPHVDGMWSYWTKK
jgi:hypothetical protein